MTRLLFLLFLNLQFCGKHCEIVDPDFADNYESWNIELRSSGLIDEISIEQLDTLHVRITQNNQIEKDRFEKYVQYFFDRPSYLGSLVGCMDDLGNLKASEWLLEPTSEVPEGISDVLIKQLFAIKSFNSIYNEVLAEPAPEGF